MFRKVDRNISSARNASVVNDLELICVLHGFQNDKVFELGIDQSWDGHQLSREQRDGRAFFERDRDIAPVRHKTCYLKASLLCGIGQLELLRSQTDAGDLKRGCDLEFGQTARYVIARSGSKFDLEGVGVRYVREHFERTVNLSCPCNTGQCHRLSLLQRDLRVQGNLSLA